MLRTMISIKNHIDIRQYHQVIAYLKRKSEGSHPKKSCIFRKEEIHQFLKEMDDKNFLLMKVVLIVGVFGARRGKEITNLMRRDVHDEEDVIKITLPNTNTKIIGEFAVTEGNIQGISCLDLFRKYMNLRLSQIQHDRFFPNYRTGKCTQQPFEVNTVRGIPKKIASALGLPEPVKYTGHCFRRSSASLLAHARADMHILKRHGGWKSDSIAEGYVERSTENKKRIATKIMGSSVVVGSTCNVVGSNKIIATEIMGSSVSVASASNVTCKEEEPIFNTGTTSAVNFQNVSNCVFYINQ